MRNYPHPKNLRRSFGSQPEVCVGNQSRPEAGIAALVIPAQSSRWTSRGRGDGFWRLADLPTLVVDDSWGNRSRTLFRLQLRRFLRLSTATSRDLPKSDPPDYASPPKAQQLSGSLLRYYRAA